MVADRKSWRSILLGCAAALGIVWAGATIVRQMFPPTPQDPQIAAAERTKEILAQLSGPIERVAGPGGKIVPANLVWEDGFGGGGLLEDIDGCLPAGPGVDVVWSGGKLYLMKEKGRLKLLWQADSVHDHFRVPHGGGTSVCFDGRYVWAALVRDRQSPLLVVVDPQTDQTRTLNEEVGVPAAPNAPDTLHFADQYLVVGPVQPGKAFVASFAGSPPLAMIEFDPNQGVRVNAISVGAPSVPAVQTGVAPVAVLNLTEPAAAGQTPRRRIVIGHTVGAPLRAGPLVIDPDSLAAEIATSDNADLPFNSSRLVNYEGALYWLDGLSTEPPKAVLARAVLPRLEREFLFDDVPDGKPVLYGDRIALLGEKCWLWKPGEEHVEAVEVEVPWTFRGDVLSQPAASKKPSPREAWELFQVFASQHYGVLAKTIKTTGENSYPGGYRFFQFALADDPRIESAPPLTPDRPKLAIDLPAGTSASELKLCAAAGTEQPPRAILEQVVETGVDDQRRYPILARELARQALLIAAREQLQWATQDATLGETLAIGAEPAARFVLSTQFPNAGAARFALHRVGEKEGVEVWSEQLTLNEDEDSPLDYARLTEAAERWSRETFPELLRQAGWRGEPNPVSDDAAMSSAADAWLKQAAFTAQFAVLRDLHHTIRLHGESDELLGALVRSYANLGVLSEFHWNAVHKACKARALLYAQRLVARKPQSAEALWHRAYARGLVGLHDSAVADLDEANKRRAAAGDASRPPRWLEIVDAYCRFDSDKLASFAAEGDCSQFAGLLEFFHLERLKESAAVQTLAQRLMKQNPEDFRLFDAMCDSCALNTLHLVTQLAPAALHRSVPERLQQLSGLPPDARELLNRAALREVSLNELAESLRNTPAEDDPGEFSWRILGRMLQEVEFIQLWRRASFLRFQLAAPADEFIAATEAVAAGHRYRPLVDLCSSDARRWQDAAEALSGRLQLEELDDPQFAAFRKSLGPTWQTRWTQQYLQAERRPALHADDVHRELLQRMESEDRSSPPGLLRRLLKVSSGSPDAVAAKLRENRKLAPDDRAAIERQFAHSPQVLKALSQTALTADEAKRTLREYLKLSPDVWAYRQLAQTFRQEGKLDEWRAALDECLRQPEFGLEHTKLRVEIANDYMDRGKWEQARPYAEEAAESWAEWAMLCAIRCCRGLGDDKQEGVWRERIVERYPKTQHALDHYVWSRRTGLGDAERILRALDPQIAAAAAKTDAESQYMIGLYYQLSNRPREALAAYLRGADGHRSVRQTCFDCLWAATLAVQLDDAKVRDQTLQRVAKLNDPSVAPFRKLAEWAQTMFALDPSQGPDLAAARDIVAAAEPSDRTGINCFFGRFLDVYGRQDEALEFYRAAIADRTNHVSATYAYVCALLRDRGLTPDRDEKPAAEPAQEKPAETAEASDAE